jgi:hypothetical protein
MYHFFVFLNVFLWIIYTIYVTQAKKFEFKGPNVMPYTVLKCNAEKF